MGEQSDGNAPCKVVNFNRFHDWLCSDEGNRASALSWIMSNLRCPLFLLVFFFLDASSMIQEQIENHLLPFACCCVS